MSYQATLRLARLGAGACLSVFVSALAWATPARDVAFVDRSIREPEMLVRALPAGVEVKVLDQTTDGLTQMAEYLQGHAPVAAIHLFSEGHNGGVKLGNRWLEGTAVEQRVDDLRRVGQA